MDHLALFADPPMRRRDGRRGPPAAAGKDSGIISLFANKIHAFTPPTACVDSVAGTVPFRLAIAAISIVAILLAAACANARGEAVQIPIGESPEPTHPQLCVTRPAEDYRLCTLLDAVAVVPEEQIAFICNGDGSLGRYNVREGRYDWLIRTGMESPCFGMRSARGETLFVLEERGVSSYRVADGSFIRRNAFPVEWPACLSIDEADRPLCLYRSGGQFRVWRSDVGLVSTPVPNEREWRDPIAISLSPHTSIACVVSKTGDLFSWDVHDNAGAKRLLVHGLPDHTHEIAIDPLRRLIAVQVDFRSCLLESLDGAEVARTSREPRKYGQVVQVAFSCDGERLAWATSCGVVHVVETASGREVAVCEPSGELRSAAFAMVTPILEFSRDGCRIMFACEYGVFLWLLPDDPSKILGKVGGVAASDECWSRLGDVPASNERCESNHLARVLGRRDNGSLLPQPVSANRSVLRALAAELDSDDYATRVRATAECARLGPSALPALRYLASASPEARQRVCGVEEEIRRGSFGREGEILGRLRLLFALSRSPGTQSLRLLRDMSKGLADAPETVVARRLFVMLVRDSM